MSSALNRVTIQLASLCAIAVLISTVSYLALSTIEIDGDLASGLSMGATALGLMLFSRLFAMQPARMLTTSYPTQIAAALALGAISVTATSFFYLPIESVRLGLIGISAALFEEVIFRGLPLLIILRESCAPLASGGIILLTSIAFSSLHPSLHPVMYVDRLVFSVLAFHLATATESVWPAVAYHLFSNSAAIALVYSFEDASEWAILIADLAIFVGIRTIVATSWVVAHGPVGGIWNR
ncbi:CPBP family intramembrane glutamic endopeptidase [Sinomonas sp. ASV322]|uniref:CPBP family intramembrane glutamic endopeptidase n=1 Tax=Sinomonas sp. ASV322 TaxID=3041920 RepID=UPI0027DDC81A|nr:CPBP family intramembrane glutamic endopeptidase [Sinomonas sp. ASV322]MDQ4502374.1 CPBP family intramembrane glutamic endopeptidase [Sinomonas sp. ASV322]